ncbi:MAG: guanylate kinase [Ottowia sp.]|nr:guanylate kinase [Ottowia sp.]
MPEESANLFVISAPSGAGKSSLVRALMAADSRLAPTVSHTTRAPRGAEQHGREYFFVSDAEFDAMRARGDFLEWAAVNGHSYGTSREALRQRLAVGDALLEIDWQGALQVKEAFPHATLMFVLPPGMDALRQRLTGRGEDAPETIELRLANALGEMQHAAQFDFVIINDVFERALQEMQTIIAAQRLRYLPQRAARADVFKSLGIF